MIYFHFEPHVPGELGEKSFIDHRFEPFKVYHLHMIFDFTPDDFCQSYPVYFISEELMNVFIDQKISGIANPRLITHEQNSQSPILKNENNYFMVDLSDEEGGDIYFSNSGIYVNDKVKLILKNFNITFGKIS